MPLFDPFKKISETLSKIQAPPASHPPEQKSSLPSKQRYEKIAYWLKAKYGDKFQEGASTDEIEKQLTKIFKEDIEPKYRSEPKYAKGFKNYIEQKQYGDLVSVE
jgi:hypothetical protein